MVDDSEFEKIQEFLEFQGKEEMHFLHKFEEEVTKHLTEAYDFSGSEAKENFIMLHESVRMAYEMFDKAENEVMRNFSMILVLVKNILEKLKEVQENSPLGEKIEIMYKELIKSLLDSLKNDCNKNIEHFQGFLNYIDNFLNPINID